MAESSQTLLHRRVAAPLGEGIDAVYESFSFSASMQEYGRIVSSGQGVARCDGLPGARAEELVLIGKGVRAFCFNLDADGVDLVLLDKGESIGAGDEVRRTGKVLDIPVGDGLLGRVLDPLGRPLDGRGIIRSEERVAIEREAPSIMDRAPVEIPLQTGIQAVDALIPVGRGQRELILGDRQTGKTAVAVDAIINQRDSEVIPIYCAVGQRASAVSTVIADLKHYQAAERAIVISASAEASPGLAFAAPFAAMSIAEFFMQRG